MTIKKQHTIVDDPFSDQNFETLYKNKAEARYYLSGTSVAIHQYQSLMSGQIVVTPAGGTSATSVTIALPEKIGVPIVALARPVTQAKGYEANVIDLTQTSIIIAIYAGGAVNGLDTSGCAVTIHYIVVGANP